MSKNVSGADNPQGSPLTILNSYDPSETWVYKTQSLDSDSS